MTEAAGIVVDAAGVQVKGVKVYAYTGDLPLVIENGEVPWHNRDVHPSTTDAEGRFGFVLSEEPTLLVALCSAGYAEMPAEAFVSTSHTLTLSPWATVKGSVFDGPRPAAGATVWLHRNVADYPGHPGTAFGSELTCDADGRFFCDRVAEGPLMVGRKITIGPQLWTTDRNHLLEVAAGETCDLQVGGVGRAVTGRFVWPDGVDGGLLSCGECGISEVYEPLEAESIIASMLPEGFAAWNEQRKRVFGESWEARELERKINTAINLKDADRISMQIPVESDGRFRSVAIDPGAYRLSYRAFKSPLDITTTRLPTATLSVDFTVPALPEGTPYLDDPLDLGDLVVTPVAAD